MDGARVAGFALEANHAAVGVIEPGDEAQQRGFAAAGGAEQRDERARLDVEVDALEDEAAARKNPFGALDHDAHAARADLLRAAELEPQGRGHFRSR